METCLKVMEWQYRETLLLCSDNTINGLEGGQQLRHEHPAIHGLEGGQQLRHEQSYKKGKGEHHQLAFAPMYAIQVLVRFQLH